MCENKLINTANLCEDGVLVATATCVVAQKGIKKMSCNCNCLLKAQSITAEDGVTTITVADETISSLCDNKIVQVGIFTSIPTESQCNRIVITDGTTSLLVARRNQYWRPCQLMCRSILILQYQDDPALFVIEDVKGRGGVR